MKIERASLDGPFTGESNNNRVGVHRQMEEHDHNFATMNLSGGPVRVDLTMSRDEFRGLAWDVMQSVVGFGDDHKAAMEEVRQIILKHLPVEEGGEKAQP